MTSWVLDHYSQSLDKGVSHGHLIRGRERLRKVDARATQHVRVKGRGGAVHSVQFAIRRPVRELIRVLGQLSWISALPLRDPLSSLACARGTDHWVTYVEPSRSSRPPSSLLSLIGSGCSIRLFSSSSMGSASRAMSDISAISVKVWCAARKSDRTSSAIMLVGTRRKTLKKMIAAVYRWTARSALGFCPCRGFRGTYT